jgi:hypothetical protein
MPLVWDALAQARLKARGHPEQEGGSRKGIFALPTQTEKFLGRLFSKRRAGSLRTVNGLYNTKIKNHEKNCLDYSLYVVGVSRVGAGDDRFAAT